MRRPWMLFVIVLFAACQDGPTLPGAGDALRMSTHDGEVEVPFSFLSPLPTTAVSGEFNPDVYPRVEVCPQPSGTCAVFTRGGGPGADLIMNGTQYQADWKLGGGAVTTYHITVYATTSAEESRILGFHELPVDVVRTLNPNSNFPIKFWIGKICTDCTQTFVGPDETTVTVPGEAQVIFPEDADRPEFTVTVNEYFDGPCLPIPHPQYRGCYDIETDGLPDGYTFNDDVIVFVCLDPAADHLRDGRLRLWKWRPTEGSSSVMPLEPVEGTVFPCGTPETASLRGFRGFLAKAVWPVVRPVNVAYAQTKTVQGYGLRDLSRFGWVYELFIEKVSGDNQWAAPGTAVPTNPTVRVTSALTGAPAPGVPVTFIPAVGTTASPVNTSTDADGFASTTWTLGGGNAGDSFTLEVAAFNPLTGFPNVPASPDVDGQPGNQWAQYGGTGENNIYLAVPAADVTFTATIPTYTVTWLTPLGTVSSSKSVSVSPLPKVEVICVPAAGWPAGGYAGCPTLLGPVDMTLSGGSYQYGWSSPSDLPPGAHYRVRVLWANEVLSEVTIRAVAGGTKTKDPFTFEAGRTVPFKAALQLQ
jgi:hypothetical protein